MARHPSRRSAIVADRRPLERGLARFLLEERGLFVVGEAATMADVLLQVQQLRPDIVVLHEKLGARSRSDRVRPDPPRLLADEHRPARSEPGGPSGGAAPVGRYASSRTARASRSSAPQSRAQSRANDAIPRWRSRQRPPPSLRRCAVRGGRSGGPGPGLAVASIIALAFVVARDVTRRRRRPVEGNAHLRGRVALARRPRVGAPRLRPARRSRRSPRALIDERAAAEARVSTSRPFDEELRARLVSLLVVPPLGDTGAPRWRSSGRSSTTATFLRCRVTFTLRSPEPFSDPQPSPDPSPGSVGDPHPPRTPPPTETTTPPPSRDHDPAADRDHDAADRDHDAADRDRDPAADRDHDHAADRDHDATDRPTTTSPPTDQTPPTEPPPRPSTTTTTRRPRPRHRHRATTASRRPRPRRPDRRPTSTTTPPRRGAKRRAGRSCSYPPRSRCCSPSPAGHDAAAPSKASDPGLVLEPGLPRYSAVRVWRSAFRFRPPGLKPTTKIGTLGPYRGRLGLAWVIAPSSRAP